MSSSQVPADLEPCDSAKGCLVESHRNAPVSALFRWAGAGFFALFCVIGFSPAIAQTAKEDSVEKRARPDYDPLGIELRDLLSRLGISSNPAAGSFLISPKLIVGMEQDDNIFRIEEDERSDRILRFRPSIRVKSDWDNHALAFNAGADVGRFQRNASEDYEDYNLGSSGRLNLSERTTAGGGVTFSKGHIARSSPDDSGQGTPLTEKFETIYNLNGGFEGERVSLRFKGAAKALNFLDAGLTNNDDQDRMKYEGSFRIGYEFVIGTTFFVEPKFNLIDYDDTFDDSGLQRSGDGYEVLSGFTWDISGVTFLELGAGFLQQHRDDSLLKTISGLSFSGDLVWNMTDLTTITSSLSRKVKETTVLDATGILETEFGLKVDYDPLENLIFNLGGSFRSEKFEGAGREEDTVKFKFGAAYLIHPNFVTEFKYAFEKRNSNEADESYKDNRWTANLTLRL